MLLEKTIDPKDLDLLTITDSPEEAVDRIADAAQRRFGFEWRKQVVKRRWWLGE
jgi:predicted Rossmann-fold nucleotide-binding protein